MDKKTSEKSSTKLLMSNPYEYFYSLVSESSKSMEFTISDTSKYYLIALLSKFISSDNLFPKDKNGTILEETLAVRFGKACQEPIEFIRSERFRQIGDFALYMAGYFSESLERKLVDLSYYMDMGEASYSEVANLPSRKKDKELFIELSKRFSHFVDILWKVSEESMFNENEEQCILKVFELWKKTGHKKFAEQLEEKGVNLQEESKSPFFKK